MKKNILEFFCSGWHLLAGSIVELFAFSYLSSSNFILQFFIITLGYSLFFGILYSLSNTICEVEINPIFTFSLWLRNKISTKQFLFTIIWQMLGGICAGALLYICFSNQISQLVIGYGNFSMFKVPLGVIILVEFLLCFLFVFCFCLVHKKAKKHRREGLYLGIALFWLLLFSIPYTGGSVNPVRALISNLFVNSDGLRQIPFYLISSLSGSLFATVIYHIYSHLNNKVS